MNYHFEVVGACSHQHNCGRFKFTERRIRSGPGACPCYFFFSPAPGAPTHIGHRDRLSATVKMFYSNALFFIINSSSFLSFFFYSGLPLPSSETLWSQPQHSSSSSFNFLPMIGAWPIPPCFEHSETWCNRGGSKSLPRAFLLGCGCRNQQQK